MKQEDIARLNAMAQHPAFRSEAARILRAEGVTVPPGQDPAVFALQLMANASPATWEQELVGMVDAHEKHYPPPPPPPPSSGFWEKALDTDRVLKEWRAVPADSRLREQAKELEAFAVKAGIGNFDGMTRGETLAAYLNVASKVDATSVEYAELAKATGGKFGNEKDLRLMVGRVADWNGTADLASTMAAREKEREEGRQGHRAAKVKIDPEAEAEQKDREAFRQAISDGLDRVKAGEPKRQQRTTIDNSDRLDWELAWRKTHNEPTDDIDLTPNVSRELAAQRQDSAQDRTMIEEKAKDISEVMR